MLGYDESNAENESSEGINISPLIDIVFILLLFFVVTSVFIEETGVDVNKPDSRQSQPLERESILIAITEEGLIFYGGEEIGLFGIAPTLKRLAPAANQSVILQADGKATTQSLLAAMDEVKSAGIENVHVATLSK